MNLSQLLSRATAATVLNTLLDLSEVMGLKVTSWRADDPTLVLYTVTAERLASYESSSIAFVRSGFLDLAEGAWLTRHARERFGVVRQTGARAVVQVRLRNTGGGFFTLEPGDVTVAKTDAQDVTYRNTTGGTLPGGVGKLLFLTFECDLEGTAGNAGIGEIETMVTSLLGVECTNLEATAGTDEESDEALRQRAGDSMAALSPNGPAAAYRYVALTAALTGTTEPTRAKVIDTSTNGVVTVYVTSPDGTISGGAVTLVQAALDKYAKPRGMTAVAVAATGIEVDVEYGLDVRADAGLDAGEVEALVAPAIEAAISAQPIGGAFNRSISSRRSTVRTRASSA